MSNSHSTYRCRFCEGRRFKVVVGGIRDWEYGVPGEYCFVSCSQCDFVQIHPFPSLEDLGKAYAVDYHGYVEAQDLGPVYLALYRVKNWLPDSRLRRLLPPHPRILDVGCGNGGFLARFSHVTGAQLTGIDFSERSVESTRARGFQAFLGTFDQFVAPEPYDMIAMNNYLEHTQAPRGELQKAWDNLKSGGHLVGEVPGFNSYERCLFKRYWGGNHVPRHTFQFDEILLRRALKEVGFEDVQVTHELNTGHWALSVQNLLQTFIGPKAPPLRHGRAWYYELLLPLFLPLNIFCVVARRAGVIQFRARKMGQPEKMRGRRLRGGLLRGRGGGSHCGPRPNRGAQVFRSR